MGTYSLIKIDTEKADGFTRVLIDLRIDLAKRNSMAGELAHGASQAHYIGFIATELLRNVSPTYLQDPESFFNTFCGSVLVPHGKEIPSMVNKPFLNYQGVGGRLFNLCK